MNVTYMTLKQQYNEQDVAAEEMQAPSVNFGVKVAIVTFVWVEL